MVHPTNDRVCICLNVCAQIDTWPDHYKVSCCLGFKSVAYFQIVLIINCQDVFPHNVQNHIVANSTVYANIYYVFGYIYVVMQALN